MNGSYLYFCLIICLCLHGIHSKSGPFRSSRRKQGEPSIPGDLETMGYRHYKYSEHRRDRSLVDDAKKGESPNPSSGHMYYLFMIENVFLNDNVWKEYFAQIGSSERHKIRNYIHASNTVAQIPPYLDAVEVPRIETHRCVDTILIMLSLLRASVANSTDDNDVFAFIAADTIPIKPFSETWQHFTTRQNARSSICVYPMEDWERQDNDANILLPRHYPWMVLTRADALKLVAKGSEMIQDIRKEFSQYSLLANYDELSPRCLDEYWFFKVLYGEITASSSSASSEESPYGITLTGNTEQGECNTFVYSENSDSDSIFRKSIRRTNVKSRNQVILSVTMQFLSDVRRSSMFFFVRRFHSHDSKFTITDRTQSTHSLVDALSKLHVYSRSVTHTNSSHHGEYNTSFINRLESFSSIKWRPKFNGGGDNGGLRVLMVSIDNRPLHDDVDKNDYISYAAVLSHEYCKFHGYDYLQFTPNNSLLAMKANNRYNTTFQPIYGDKYGLSVFNTYLRHARSSSWAKLPVLWYLTMLFGEMYDYFWFMDSDATINPLRRNRSLYDALSDWSVESSNQVVRGVKDPRDATFVFLSNFPWRDDLPCAGVMIFKPMEAEPILREWWDYYIPDKNFYDFMEQDALWYMLEAPESYKFLMNFETTATLVVENQFPSAWKGVTELWTTHIPNYESSRNQYFRNMLRLSSVKFRETYSAVINYILKREHMIADIFDIALAMEEYDYAVHHRNHGNVTTKRGNNQYPPCLGGRADDIWHTARNTHLRPAQPPRGRLYNNLPIAIPPNRAIWLVLNDTRRAFPSMDSFIKMGFDLDMVLHFSGRDPANSIPVGADLHD